MRLLISVNLFFLLNLLVIAQPAHISTENELNISKRVDSLLSIMTLEEKIGQLNQLSYGAGWGPDVEVLVPSEMKELVREGKIGSFLNAIGAELTGELQQIAVNETRLGIPLLFGYDVIHGFKTIFPMPLGEASSWDPEVIEMSARYQARESAAVGIHWTFSPMVDIARDPRWGRIVEGYGEDPHLTSVMSVARVKGLQGNLSDLNLIACAKHFAAYGGAEGGRDYNTVDISERTLREIYLPPFKAAVDAGVETFMSSFNEIGGIPVSGSKFLLTKILREEWGFNGFVVSDWNSIGELVAHGFSSDLKDAGRISIDAGIDMDMESRSYVTYLKTLVENNTVPEETIDTAVRRILRIKFLLGLFEDPYRFSNIERESKTVMNSEMLNAAFEVAKKSIVLLKNEGDLLPLSKDLKKIAVIGPLADSKKEPLGSWEQQGSPNDVVSILEGLKKYAGGTTEFSYAEGCGIDNESTYGFKEALRVAEASDLVILCLGERGHMSGESNCRSTLELPGIQNDLAREIYKTGKPIVVILLNGRPLSINWISENMPAIVEAWFPGTRTGDAVASVLYGDYNPSGKLPVTFPRTVGQIPIYYNHKNTGRPGNEKLHYNSKYLDLPLTPLYPFGYGLSYTTFEYSDLVLDKNTIEKNDKLKISVTVKNTGRYDGEEVVQLYIRDLFGSVTRPVKELKGFKKVFLKKHESKVIDFILTESNLRFWDADMNFVSEPGEFEIFVGTNSVDTLKDKFTLK